MVAKARGSSSSSSTVRRSTAILIAALTFTAGITIGTLLPGGGTSGGASVTQAGRPGESSQKDTSHIQSARQLTESQPGSADAWIHLGDAYYDAGIFEQAVTAYERGLAIAPDNANAHTDLGTAYRLTGQFNKAIAHYNEALLRQPRHSNARLNKGIVLYYDLGRKQEALDVWNALLQMNPDAKGPNDMSLKEFLSRLAG